jgi:hypothetical protein
MLSRLPTRNPVRVAGAGEVSDLLPQPGGFEGFFEAEKGCDPADSPSLDRDHVGNPVLDLNPVAFGCAVERHNHPVVSRVNDLLWNDFISLELVSQVRQGPVELFPPCAGAVM